MKKVRITYPFLIRVPIEVEVRFEYNEGSIEDLEIINHKVGNIDYLNDELQQSLYATDDDEYSDFLSEVKKLIEV